MWIGGIYDFHIGFVDGSLKFTFLDFHEQIAKYVAAKQQLYINDGKE